MNTRLSLLVVFLKLLLPAPGTSLSPELNTSCPANTTISGDDERANIYTVQSAMNGSEVVLYVHPDPGFKGVWLAAKGDGWQHDAWFTLDYTCFPRDIQWWRLRAGVWRVRKDDNNNDGYLDFVVRTGDCFLGCRIDLFPGAMNATVEAHGPSRWRFREPTPCTEEGYKQQDVSWINCTSHLTTTTTTITTPTTTITIIVVPVIGVVVVVVVVVLLLVVAKCYRQRGVNPDMRMRFQGSASESEVVENSLYETLDNTRRTEVVENSLYEPLDNTRRTEVVENSLYEPLDNVRKPR